jgi:heat shock protein HtpX
MFRVGLFLATNFAVLLVLSVVLNLLGLGQQGAGIGGFLLIASLFGMGGAFISLFMSKKMARRAVNARSILQPKNELERWLISTVKQQAVASNIKCPEVAIFESETPNAFATGADRNASLVAVSTGLLRSMTRDEVEAVLAHEVSHVSSGDMVTLALLQGVMNTFVMVLAHILAAAIDRNSRGRGMGYYIGYFVAQMILGFLASLLVMWFSRFREYKADLGGARLAGKEKMISALQKLQSVQIVEPLPDDVKTFGINGSLSSFLSTHPPLSARIDALRKLERFSPRL